ncbi:hypothetical protein [Streptomyces hoynatensis]|uniref:SRPBCC family protein n=1 Tax=Streptomyces hoynatensis TaxID=1141874 RepID=A0A3A9ZE79_9ACTN|nr:hypothetical protein [Streptomyces hoynatensis]RKN45557.1 hypothetical protein D7294_03485 [Streptomyces hoynatensis]
MEHMGDVRVSVTGGFPPAAFVGALTDFGQDRAKVWGNSTGRVVVHDRGDSWADVTEGTRASGIWQRYRYEWSPEEVRLDVTDSNAFGAGSYWLYRLTAEADGARTRIDLHIHRVPTTFVGRLFEPLLRLFGGFYFGRDLRRSVRRVEQLSAEKDVR